MTDWNLPPLDALDGPAEAAALEPDHVVDITRALSSAGVAVEDILYQLGPQATSYGVRLAPGVLPAKVERALPLVELAVGRPVRYGGLHDGRVGLEVARLHRATVTLREVLAQTAPLAHAAALPIPVGVDLHGRPQMRDLAGMPHLIVAGTTGAGKSAYLHAILATLILHRTPDEMNLHLIDPKQVELTAYADLPHVRGMVTEAHDAAEMLRDLVRLMDARYLALRRAGVQNLADYNALDDGPPMRREVVVVEELADLLMSGQGKIISQRLERLAQLGRAAGIHLVVATQRPSAKVLPELLRANVPARAVFAVSTDSDGQVALGQTGARALTGRGDGLFLSPGEGDPVRFQAPYVSATEIAWLVSFWARQAPELTQTHIVEHAGNVVRTDVGATLRDRLDLEAAQRRQDTVDIALEEGVDPGEANPHDMLREWGFPDVVLDALADVLADRMADRIISRITGIADERRTR